MAEQVASVQERLENYLAAEEGEVEEEQAPAQAQPEPTQEDAPETTDVEKEEPKAQEEEVEEVAISSFQELAEHLKISPEELYSLEVNVTGADGAPKQVPLGEWKDSYQASELLKTEREKFGQERVTFEQEVSQKKQAMDAVFFTASKVLEDTEKNVLGYIDNQLTDDLRVNDPAEYALKLTERDRAEAQLTSRKAELKGEYGKLMNAQQQEMQAQQAQSLQQAYQALPQFIPEWADEEVATHEKSQLVKYGLGEGYTEQELSSLVDPRVVRSLRKAMMYDAQQKAAPAIKKKVVSIGKKVIKGGKSQSKTERKADDVKQDLAKFRKGGGHVQDAADLIEKHFLKD